jgi:hypothetical protein
MLGHQTLIDGLDIFGEPVNNTSSRVSVEPSHGSTHDTREGSVVERARSVEGTEQNADIDTN